METYYILSGGQKFSGFEGSQAVPARPSGTVTFFLLLLFGFRFYWHCCHTMPIVPCSGDSEYDS
jgi:hypothetical protein